jgi:hypothetical protein
MNLEALAQQLVDGKITVAQWQAAMREYIRIIHVDAAAIAMGGRQNVTQSQWGYIGSLIKKQYAYLDNFVQDILDNPQAWLNGRLFVRMQLYERAAWGTFEQVIRRQMEAMGYDEERRVLGMADHCFVTGTLVKTPSGDKPIEKIRIGEYVVTRFGNKMVTRTFVNDYYGDLLNVSSGENSVITTKNHPFLTDNGWKRADNLSCLDNTVIFENGTYVLRRHVTIPNAFNNIPAGSKIRISSPISGLLSYLPFVQRIKSWMSMPPFAVSLNNQPSDSNINNEVGFNNYSVFVFNFQRIKDFMKFFFKSRWFIFLKFCISKKELLDNVWTGKSLFSQPFFSSILFGRVIISHVLSGFGANKLPSGFFRKWDTKFVGFISNPLIWNIKAFGTPFCTTCRVMPFKKRNIIFIPNENLAAFLETLATFFRVPIFLVATMTDKTAMCFKRLSGTLFAYSTNTMVFFSALGANLFRWSGWQVWPAFSTEINTPLSYLSANGAGTPIDKFGMGIVGNLWHILFYPSNDKYNQIIPRSIKIYNLEIEDVHEYIANNFVVHNCNGCLDQASLGWQPIGTLDGIGEEECLSNCHCVFEYRKNDMLFAPRDVEKASEMLFAPALE